MLLYWVYVIYRRGGAGVLCLPLSAVVAPSCALSGHVSSTRCLLVLSFRLVFWLRPSDPMYLRGWDGVGGLLGLGISRRAYLNKLIPDPSFHCGCWTLVLCAGTLYPRMHRCVARTKVMEILLLTYPHVLE